MARTNRWITVLAMSAASVLAMSCGAESDAGTSARNDSSATPSSVSNEPTTTATASPGIVAPAAAAIAAPASDSDWPCFRGPTGMGVSSAKGLPTTWSESENIVWKTPLPGAGASSPIVLGDRIYLTSYTGYLVPGDSGGSLDALERHLLCLKRDDGAIVWKKSVKAKQPEEERIRDHGYAANTPAADADRVYVFFGKSGVYAFDHAGKEQWHTDVGSGTSGWGTAASPVLYKNLVIINASVESESIIALDRRNGEEKWRARGIKESWNTPIIVKTQAGAEELVFAMHGKVLGLDPMSGEQLWSCDTNITWYMVPSVVAADGVVYVLGGRSGTAALAVRAGGRGDVTQSHRLWISNDGSNVTSPVFQDGYLYWMHESKGVAYCAKAATGEVVYAERMDRGGQVYASSVLADGRVYHLDRSGRMYVVAAKPKFELLATNDLRDRSQFNSSPAIAGGRLYVRSDKYLYCVGK